MTSHAEAESYIAGSNPNVRRLASRVHETLVALGCSSYVKTIYVGYDLAGEMVAALYVHSDHAEVALALPEDTISQCLIDASHLTWRTLPVAAVVRSLDDLHDFGLLAAEACSRVRTGTHDVMRDNDHFQRISRSRGRPQGGHAEKSV